MNRFLFVSVLLGASACSEPATPASAATDSGATTGESGEDSTESGAVGQDESSSGSEAPVTVCGNGALDFAELCDDGNTVDADGCNADCVPSGSLLWNWEPAPKGQLLDAQLDAQDNLHLAALHADATVLTSYDRELVVLEERRVSHASSQGYESCPDAAGELGVTASGAKAWVRSLCAEADGGEDLRAIRLRVDSGADEVPSETVENTLAASLVASELGFVVAYESVAGTFQVVGYGLDGTREWTRDVAFSVTELTATDGGPVIATGAAIHALDPGTGATLWTVDWVSERGPDTVAVSPSGSIRFLGRDDLPLPARWSLDLDHEGGELDRRRWDPVGATETGAGAFDDHGNFVFADRELVKLDPADAELWRTPILGLGSLQIFADDSILALGFDRILLFAP